MRLLTCLFLCAALGAAGTISPTPPVPFAGTAVTLTLLATPASAVAWDYGNGRAQLQGGPITTYVYPAPGSFTVRATYQVLNAQQQLVTETAQAYLRVADPQGPEGPFAITGFRLRWEDGGTDCSMAAGDPSPAAFLDLRHSGTGLLAVQWLLDGLPVATQSRSLAFAGTATLDLSEVLPLPTTEPGEHFLTLRFLAPAVDLPSPRIRYFVRLDEGERPRITEVAPAYLHPGDEAEVRIRGTRLARGQRLSFGKDIVVVAPLRITGPGRAVARIFVAPTARPGFRPAVLGSRNGEGRGPAGLRIESRR